MNPFKVALVSIDRVRDDSRLPTWVSDRLAAEGVELVFRQCDDRETLKATAGDADLVWVFGGGRIVTADAVADLPRCKALLRTGSGTDNMPVEEATRRGILVVNTPQATEQTVSDHAIALLLSILRCIPQQDRAIHQGVWDRNLAWPDWHIAGSTLGLVGFGRIARRVVRKLGGFELKFLASDPVVTVEEMQTHGVRSATLDELLTKSDFVSIHAPLTDKTRHLISDRELQLMKQQAILINTSRGSIIDELALARALADGQIAAAGLDVLESEPPVPDNPLTKMNNVVFTPHAAPHSDHLVHDFWHYSVEAVIDMANGRLPASYVNPQVTSASPFKPGHGIGSPRAAT